MNTVLKVSAAGALALAGVAAHASIASPSSGSSDAILFAEVVNAAGTAAVASFAGDTGVSISSLTSPISGSTTYLAGNANLTTLFAADAAGDTVWFAVLGGQYTGLVNTTNFKTPGVAQFVTTTYGNGTNALSISNNSTLTKYANINTDINNINSNSGGASTFEGSNPATSGVWDVTNTAGLAYWDGGQTPNGNVIGAQQNLYYVTAGVGGAVSTKVSYTVEGLASLSAAGLVLSAPPTVPLPPAIWLLGSGLLGLTGVARRKLKA
jgi:hypothetical protein